MTLKEIRKQARASLAPVKIKMAVIALIYFIFVAGSAILTLFGIGALFTYVFTPCLTMSFTIISINVVRKRPVAISNLGKGFGHFTTCFLLNLLNSLYIALWSLLFVVPGIIRSYAYSMSYFVLADNPKMSQSEVREESIHLMEGNKMRLFYLSLSMLPWLLLGVATGGILLFYALPYCQVVTAQFYETIKAEKAPPVYVPLEEVSA
ncbi:MAG: DUF975 family protein [Clostridia bacterium]|nr:DUF975 family protein [Clostridia bacterium]MBR2464902.1 DUF975 family protein [Clostridia bacterium]MBR3863024.1 DUF975 family protein [Clostridia bacterium]